MTNKALAIRNASSYLKGQIVSPSHPARAVSLLAHKALIAANNQFLDYVDPEGNASTSRKGFAVQLNKQIKDMTGESVKSFFQLRLMLLAALRGTLAEIIVDGIEKNKLRKEIRQACYKKVETFIPMMMEASK